MPDIFKVKCWNCSKKWTVEIGEYESIGYEKDLTSSSYGDKLIIKSGTKCGGIKCSACNQYGSHTFNWVEEVEVDD